MQICNFRKRKFVVLLALSIASFGYAQNAFYLRAGHRVSIVLLTELDSQQRPTSPSAVVAADVYDDSGMMILIRKGTSVLVQVQCRKEFLCDVEASLQRNLRMYVPFDGAISEMT